MLPRQERASEHDQANRRHPESVSPVIPIKPPVGPQSRPFLTLRRAAAPTAVPQQPVPFRHMPADEATIAHNQRREAEWHARHQHQPATPDVVAHNQAAHARWIAALAALDATLRDLAPQVFNDQPPPVAIGIHQALVELLAGDFDPDIIKAFLRGWCRQPAYLAAVAAGEIRRDLDGQPTILPTDAERDFARRRSPQ